MTPDAASRSIALYPTKAHLFKSLALYRLLVPTPQVLVNETGIDYHPVSLWLLKWRRTISWAEIAAMYLSEVTIQTTKGAKTRRYLSIVPKDLDAFVLRYRLFRRLNMAFLVIAGVTETPFVIPAEMIAPFSLDELFAQICTQFQAEIQANGIEIREEQKTEVSPQTKPTVALGKDAFHEWLEEQGPIVGTGRDPVGVKPRWRPHHQAGEPPAGANRQRRDDTPLARYLSHILGRPVYIVLGVVFPLPFGDPPLGRLPQWAEAFDKQVQSKPEKTVTKEEALAALDTLL